MEHEITEYPPAQIYIPPPKPVEPYFELTFSGTRQTLFNDDCMRVLQSLPDASVDCVLTDPPYCSGGSTVAARAKSVSVKYQCSNQVSAKTLERPLFSGDLIDQITFKAWCEAWLKQCFRVCKNGAPIFCFIDWRQLPMMLGAFAAADIVVKNLLVWDKTRGCRPNRGWFSQQAEFIIAAIKSNRNVSGSNFYGDGVLTFPRKAGDGDSLHITCKPVPLLKKLLAVLGNSGGTVLDPFVGSGSTLIAAAQCGLNGIGVEVTPEYSSIAKERLIASENQQTLNIQVDSDQ